MSQDRPSRRVQVRVASDRRGSVRLKPRSRRLLATTVTLLKPHGRRGVDRVEQDPGTRGRTRRPPAGSGRRRRPPPWPRLFPWVSLCRSLCSRAQTMIPPGVCGGDRYRAGREDARGGGPPAAQPAARPRYDGRRHAAGRRTARWPSGTSNTSRSTATSWERCSSSACRACSRGSTSASRTTARSSTTSASRPATSRASTTCAPCPSPRRPTSATTTRAGCSRYPWTRSSRSTPRRGPRASPWCAASRRPTSTPGRSWSAASRWPPGCGRTTSPRWPLATACSRAGSGCTTACSAPAPPCCPSAPATRPANSSSCRISAPPCSSPRRRTCSISARSSRSRASRPRT